MQLIAMLQNFARVRRRSVEVYFDRAPAGQAKTRRFGTVTAHFVREGLPADDMIIARLRKLGRAAPGWTVVSSDRRIQAEVHHWHAAVVPSEQFVSELMAAQYSDTPTAPRTLSPDEVDDWLHLFGDPPGEG